MILEAMYYDGTIASAEAICRWTNDNGHCIAPVPEGEEDCEEAIASYIYEGTKVVDFTVFATNDDEPTEVRPGSYLIRQEDGQVTVCPPDPSL